MVKEQLLTFANSTGPHDPTESKIMHKRQIMHIHVHTHTRMHTDTDRQTDTDTHTLRVHMLLTNR